MSNFESQNANVFIFNASNDDALADNFNTYTPNRLIKKLEHDLAVLPFLFANRQDIVLVDELPSIDTYCKPMNDLGFVLPNFVSKQQFFSETSSGKNGYINELKPWGWSKAIHTYFSSSKQYTSAQFQASPSFVWNDSFRQMSCRTFSRDILSQIISNRNKYIVPEKAIPTICNNVNDCHKLIENEQKIIVKAPWSSSGRGVLMLDKNHYNQSNRQWILSVLKKQGFVMIEPWFDKKVDFSFLYNVQNSTIKLLCLSQFQTTNRGQFLGSYINWSTHNEYIAVFPDEVFTAISDAIIKTLYQTNFTNNFEGWFGVDAMIVNENNSLLVHPCLEINCRYTVGHLAFCLRKFVAEKENAIFRIGTYNEYLKAKADKEDLKIRDGKIASGVGSITPINQATQFVGWIEVP